MLFRSELAIADWNLELDFSKPPPTKPLVEDPSKSNTFMELYPYELVESAALTVGRPVVYARDHTEAQVIAEMFQFLIHRHQQARKESDIATSD